MPVGIKTPSNQIKFTNLALVRMKKGKKRYEIACYKNKVLDWRKGNDNKLDNVLQSREVFLNISRGQVASKADLEKSFGKGMTRGEVVQEILLHGEVQVGEKERTAELDRIKNEVIEFVASRLVDPKTKRVYTAGMIEKALDQLSSQSRNPQGQETEDTDAAEPEEKEPEKPLPTWTGVVSGKEAKPQALKAIEALVARQPIPVARMQMKLRITCPTSVLKQGVKSAPKAAHAKNTTDGEEKAHGNVKDTILGLMAKTENQDVVGAEWELVGLVEPGTFKTLNEFIETHTKGRGNVEVLEKAIGADD